MNFPVHVLNIYFYVENLKSEITTQYCKLILTCLVVCREYAGVRSRLFKENRKSYMMILVREVIVHLYNVCFFFFKP